MVEPNENFVIFLTLFVLSFSLPKFLLLFGAKLLFMLLIAFQVLLSTIKLHMSAFLGHLQIITTFAPLALLVSFFFNHMSITNLSLGQGFVIFLAMTKRKRGIGVMILSLIVFISPAMLCFGNIAPLSSSLTSVPPYLSPVLDIFPEEAHIPSVVVPDPPVTTPNSPIDFSVQPPNIFDNSPKLPLMNRWEMNRSKMSHPILSLGP